MKNTGATHNHAVQRAVSNWVKPERGHDGAERRGSGRSNNYLSSWTKRPRVLDFKTSRLVQLPVFKIKQFLLPVDLNDFLVQSPHFDRNIYKILQKQRKIADWPTATTSRFSTSCFHLSNSTLLFLVLSLYLGFCSLVCTICPCTVFILPTTAIVTYYPILKRLCKERKT